MALTTEQIDVLYMRNGLGKFHLPAAPLQYEYDHCIHDFARAIEAEVHKQDTELIRQMLEALDDGSEHTAQCITNYYIRPCDCKKVTTITAARARLGEKT